LFGAAMLAACLAGPAAAQQNWTGAGQDFLGVGNCGSVPNLSVSLYVTQDMVASTYSSMNGVPVLNGGFSLQLNATPSQPNGVVPQFNWLQYLIVVQSSKAFVWIQYFNTGNGHVNNPPNPTILNLPSNMIPAGYTLNVALTTDPTTVGVTGASLTVTDNNGNATTLSMPSTALPLPTSTLNNQTILSPFYGFLTNIVGPPTNTNYSTSTFSSGAGYLTYQSSAPLVSQTTNCGVMTSNEGSNVAYGVTSPSSGRTLVQPFVTPWSGALATNMDTADGTLQVYNFVQSPHPTQQNYGFLNMFGFNGTWNNTNVMTSGTVPAVALGSPLLSYENTIYNAPEAFYLAPAANGQAGQQIEHLWGKTWSLSPLTSLANAQPAAMGSGLVGFIDPLANTDNVFYQGTDNHIHVLTWAPGKPWKEDTTLPAANAPVAAFASALTGHMNAQSEELFYVGADRHIHEVWRWSKNFDGWHTTDITLVANNGFNAVVVIGSPLASFYDPGVSADCLFYLGTNWHVFEMENQTGVWTASDVTTAAGAPAVGPGSTLAAHVNVLAHSEEVFAVNADQSIEELWSFSTPAAVPPTWNAAGLFAAAGGSPVTAINGSPLATDINTAGSESADEVYYIGTDGNVHGLSWNPNNKQWSGITP